MKLIFAIVHKDDGAGVSAGLTRGGFFVTQLSTSGGFLKAKNTTFMVVVDAARVDEALGLIERHCKKRVQAVSPSLYADTVGGAPMPSEVTVGGATVFIANVERFEKI